MVMDTEEATEEADEGATESSLFSHLPVCHSYKIKEWLKHIQT